MASKHNTFVWPIGFKKAPNSASLIARGNLTRREGPFYGWSDYIQEETFTTLPFIFQFQTQFKLIKKKVVTFYHTCEVDP